jgi:hypothetical protein
MIRMKMFKATIEAVTMSKDAENVVRTSTETIVPANDRYGAIMVALDMGQAMARTVNTTKGLALYFRVVGVQETDEAIA